MSPGCVLARRVPHGILEAVSSDHLSINNSALPAQSVWNLLNSFKLKWKETAAS